jgi:hypothetical protein
MSFPSASRRNREKSSFVSGSNNGIRLWASGASTKDSPEGRLEEMG